MAFQNIDLSRAAWRKSTHSNNGGNCVEVARNLADIVAVRDSKQPDGPKLVVQAGEWRALIAYLRQARFER